MSTPVLLCMVVSMQYVCVCEVSEVDTFSRVDFRGLEGGSCGWVAFDQMHSATEHNVAHHVVSRLQKLMRQGDSRHAVTPAQHTLDLRV